MAIAAPITKAPFHTWIVGIAALLFNAGGAYHYLMVKMANPDFMAQMPEGAAAYYQDFPLWMDIVWPLAVWTAVSGALLVLLRKKVAVTAFLVSFVSYLVNAFYTFGIATPPAAMMTSGNLIFSVVIGAQLLVLWLYSRAMTAKGVLQ